MIDLVLPVYNPSKGWEKNAIARTESLEKLIGEPIRLIVVNDGSTDKTVTNAMEYLAAMRTATVVIHQDLNVGKGAALRAGLSESDGDLIILTDADFPFDEPSMLGVYQKLSNNFDVVLGKRTKSYYQSLPFARRLLSASFNVFTRLVFGKYPGDTQAGLKGLSLNGKQAFLETKTNGFLADFEFVRRAIKLKLKMTYSTIQLNRNVAFESFRKNVIRREFNSLLRIFGSKKS